MKLLIDAQYFTTGPRHIYNVALGVLPPVKVGSAPAGVVEVLSFIESYIRNLQPVFLRQLLGRENALLVKGYLDALEDGAEGTKAFDEICEWLKEPFADYVFYHFLADANYRATITGTVVLKSDNRVVSPATRQAQAWNRMVDNVREFTQWASSEGCILKEIVTDSDLLTKINSLNV